MVALWLAGRSRQRAGFAVSRQVAGSVRRNRVRRRLREAYRRLRAGLPAGVHVIFVGRPAALSAPFATLLADIESTVAAIARAGRSAETRAAR